MASGYNFAEIARTAVLIKLANDELAQCTIAGLQRLLRKLAGHNSGHYYNNSLSFQERVCEESESVAAEWAVAKYYDLPFDPMKANNHFKHKADVGNEIGRAHV